MADERKSQYHDMRMVVYCCDCKHAHMTAGGECKYCDMFADMGDVYFSGMFFCAFGERKEEVKEKIS